MLFQLLLQPVDFIHQPLQLLQLLGQLLRLYVPVDATTIRIVAGQLALHNNITRCVACVSLDQTYARS